MDEKYVKYMWMILKNAIQQIQQENSELSPEELYSKANEVVMNKHGFRMYNGLRELLTDHLKQKVRQELLQNLHSNFLTKLNEAWIEHQTEMLMLSDMLGYMDDTYAKQRGLDSVYNMGLKIFRYEIVECADIKKILQEKLLELIKEDRIGKKIIYSEIKNTCCMFLKLGINSRYFYEQIFEIILLAETEKYFEIKFQKIMEENGADYVKQMKLLSLNESSRAANYLDQETITKIVQVIESIIEKHTNLVKD